MAVAFYECGQAAGSTDTLVIPITADIPRSDPIGGATLILIYYQLSYLSAATITAITDDAPIDTDDGYSLCIYADGLNHYGITGQPLVGLLVNPLVNGANSITVSLDSVPDWIQAVAVAVTGAGATYPSNPLDPTLAFLPAAISQTAEAPAGAPTSSSGGVGWTQDTFGAITFGNPTAATDGDWDWDTGDVAFYIVQQIGQTSDPVGWTWADAAIDDFVQWDVDPGIGRYQAFALGTAPVVPTLPGPSIAGAWTGGPFTVAGQGLAVVAGPGPVCASPPPTFGNPTFNKIVPACAARPPAARSAPRQRFERTPSGLYLPTA